MRSGTANHMWKGDDAGYFALHCWIAKHFEKTGECEHCGSSARPTEFASVNHTYTRDRVDWLELCRKCHRKQDAKTHCKREHPFDERNTCHRKDGSRLCRACARDYAKERRRASSGVGY
jgi:hypothetical protein